MQTSERLISICIPTYKNISYLKHLMDSIGSQTFKDFEVVVSDDSSDNTVLDFLEQYKNKFPVRYFKNTPALGTPANWNFAIRQAKGEWIKLIHDDDWLLNTTSLENFALATKSGKKFITSAYTNCFEGSSRTETMTMSRWMKKRILKEPVTLLANNVIGPPSVTLVHHSIKEIYEERMKWRVDMDFYIRLLRNETDFTYIKEPLVGVGISPKQVTNECLLYPEVEIPEGYLLLEKYGTLPLKNVRVFDAWWRILRNLSIKEKRQLELFGNKPWPLIIEEMVKQEAALPSWALKNGVTSKLCMILSYLKDSGKAGQWSSGQYKL